MYELRPYQQAAINNIKTAFVKGKNRIMVCSPTGSGKGVMLSHIINSAANKGSTVLFLVHRREIVNQISAYMDHYEIPHGVIMAGDFHDPRFLVNLASIQTIVRRMEQKTFEPSDIIIVDEAHHATAATYLKVINAFQKKLLIGFSATPVRKSGMGLGNLFDELITVATISDLVKDGFLVPTRYYAPFTPDLSGVKITAGDYNEKQLNMVMLQGQITKGIVENWQKYGEDRQTICFTATVAHSVAVCEAFQAAGIPAEHIDGKSELEERKKVLRRYRNGDVRVLCNCAVFTEGVDIPQIACVIMARPTKSISMYLQCIGRGMRICDGKKDMILLDHAGVYWEHGPVEEITEWTLDETKKIASEKNEERKEKNSKPIECKQCGRVYTGQLKCPSCGTIPDIKRYGEDVDYIDGVLGEIVYKGGIGKKQKKPEKKEATKDEKQAFYSQLMTYCYNKNYAPGWISHKYRERFGVWPKSLTQVRQPVTDLLSNWIKHQAIRAAKGRESANAR
jgi:superfamily II DNA or RNA helicase